MDNPQKISLVGFIAALVALEIVAPANAQALESRPQQRFSTVEARLSRLTKTLQSRVTNLPETAGLSPEARAVAQWINGGGGGFANIPGGGGFVNRRGGGGFGNARGGGGFLNNPWRNGWGDGGGFLNRRY